MLLLLKIVVGLLTLGILVIKDYNKAKEPFDQKRKVFSAMDDWWRWRKDNVFIMLALGVLGWFLASELAVPIMNKYMEWPELAEGAIDLTGVVVVVFFFARVAPKLIGFKDS